MIAIFNRDNNIFNDLINGSDTMLPNLLRQVNRGSCNAFESQNSLIKLSKRYILIKMFQSSQHSRYWK